MKATLFALLAVLAVFTSLVMPSRTTAAARLPTLCIIGDSTVKNHTAGLEGWGDPIGAYFDKSKIVVVNHALGGRSSRTFLTEGLWDKALADLKPGDFVLMQFGHNDGGSPRTSDRASLKGVGEETQSVVNPKTNVTETIHSYGWYLRKYIADAKAKGATAIVLSPIPRNIWSAGGKVARSGADYGLWAAQAAKSGGALFVDLNAIIADKYDALGPDKVKAYFPGDHTHTSPSGAEMNAGAVVEGLKGLKDCPLVAFLASTPPVFPPAALANAAPANTPVEAALAPTPAGKGGLKFAFGTGVAPAGFVRVPPTTAYTPERGYGFEPGPAPAVSPSGVTGDKPFLFSVALPDGDYNVTLKMGDETAATTTTVKAESRRLMLEKVETAPGKTATRTFTVNVRTPQIKGGGEVRLKSRESGPPLDRDWDDRLTLEFNDTRPSLDTLEIAPAPDAVTVYLAGDSTVTDQPTEPWCAWGQMLPRFFGPGVAVANNAESGESLRSFSGAGRLSKVLSTMKAGDYLFIQFGHNDQKEHGDGVGAFTTYAADLKRFIAEARKRGGLPILVTPMNRRRFDADGKIVNTLGDYPEAVRRTAKEEDVPLLDLNAMSKTLFEAMGPQGTLKAFVHYPAGTFPDQPKELKDDTHFNGYGAYQLAKCIVEGIKADKLALAKSLVPGLPAFDPARPDPADAWRLPASSLAPAVKPDGS